MANAVDEGLLAANNVIQGFVDMIPGGRSIVDFAHDAQQYGEVNKYDYNKLIQKDSGFYLGGQLVGIAWNMGAGTGCLRALRLKAPTMAASKYACVANVGKLILDQKKAIDVIDTARKFMEGCRAFNYTCKLWCNQARLNKGLINRQQFDKMQAGDLLNYQMGSVMWAIPGQYGLYLAGLNMMVGTIIAQQNLNTVGGGKK